MDLKTEEFEAARPQLVGLAYRLLGSISDAQDAVQDTYLKWLTYKGDVDVPVAWLSRVCTNRCLDQLKSGNQTRLNYVGQWIPDQIQTEFESSAEDQLEFASSLTTAFLLLLERLTPKERAAYLLHDVFSMPFAEVATVLETQPANCRKLAARARTFVSGNTVRHVPKKQRQEELVLAFQDALRTGDTNKLGTVLRDDAGLRADSGGKVHAVRDVVEGREPISAFLKEVLCHAWSSMDFSQQMINGTLGMVVKDGDGLHATVSFGYDAGGNIGQIYIMRHPDKLARFAQASGLVSGQGKLRFQPH